MLREKIKRIFFPICFNELVAAECFSRPLSIYTYIYIYIYILYVHNLEPLSPRRLDVETIVFPLAGGGVAVIRPLRSRARPRSDVSPPLALLGFGGGVFGNRRARQTYALIEYATDGGGKNPLE